VHLPDRLVHGRHYSLDEFVAAEGADLEVVIALGGEAALRAEAVCSSMVGIMVELEATGGGRGGLLFEERGRLGTQVAGLELVWIEVLHVAQVRHEATQTGVLHRHLVSHSVPSSSFGSLHRRLTRDQSLGNQALTQAAVLHPSRRTLLGPFEGGCEV